MKLIQILFTTVAALALCANTANAQSTAFTYQGRVLDNGTNFNGTGQFKFALVTSTNQTHQATATANLSGQFVTSYNIVSGGNGYVSVPTVTVSGGGGSGATATAVITGGVVTSINPGSAGTGYTSTPTVTLSAPPVNISYVTYWSNDGTSSAGSEPTATVSIGVSNGIFTVVLGDTTIANMTAISTALFNQPNLQLRIWFNDGVNGSAALSPMQNLTPAPYAVFANNASNAVNATTATTAGTATTATTATTAATASAVGANGVNTVAIQNNAVTAAKIATGQVVKSVNGLQDAVTLSAGNNVTITPSGQTLTIAASSPSWALTGNSGTIPATQFVGTTDNQALEFRVNNARAFRLEPNSSSAPNMIGGFSGNWVAPGTIGATIGGGGAGNYLGNIASNSIADNFCTIGGGWQNLIQVNSYESTIGGGQLNTIQAFYSTISGGYGNGIGTGAHDSAIGGGNQNTNASTYATIGGGLANSIQQSSDHSTIAGGDNNSIQQNGGNSTISGGINNSIQSANSAVIAGGGGNVIQSASGNSTISGGGANTIQSGATYATIPGGDLNTVGASYSFAAGKFATAAHISTFVWGDGNGGTTSTASSQFVVRCSGGAIFYTASGTSTGVQLASGGGSWSSLSDRNVKENFAPVDAKAVLEKVAEMPMSTWNYLAQERTIRHIGPMAQDFYAAFDVGEDNRHITTVDEGGVALAAIQGLNQKLKEKDAEIQILAQQNNSLGKRLSELEHTVQSLAGQK